MQVHKQNDIRPLLLYDSIHNSFRLLKMFAHSINKRFKMTFLVDKPLFYFTFESSKTNRGLNLMYIFV